MAAGTQIRLDSTALLLSKNSPMAASPHPGSTPKAQSYFAALYSNAGVNSVSIDTTCTPNGTAPVAGRRTEPEQLPVERQDLDTSQPRHVERLRFGL